LCLGIELSPTVCGGFFFEGEPRKFLFKIEIRQEKDRYSLNQKAPSTMLQGCGAFISFVDPSFKPFGQDRVYSNLYRNKG